MGNTVTLNPLTIIIHNQTSESNNQVQVREIFSYHGQKIQLSFPFYLAEGKNNEILYINDKQSHLKSQKKLLYKCNMTGFSNIVVENIGAGVNHKIWKMIYENQTLPFEPNDIIKIGSLQIKLKYLINEGNLFELFDPESVIGQKSHSYRSSQFSNLSGGPKCRVCFQPEIKNNPLISLCKCQGSVKLIHYNCLRTWIQGKIKYSQEPNCTIYQYQPLLCQLCKTILPSHFYHENIFYSLIQKEKLQPPYTILEMKNNLPNQKHEKITIYRVKLNEGLSVTIGRSGEADIPVKSSTVSRKHCFLFYSHKQLFVKDLKSKFGSFLYTKNAQYEFNPEIGLILGIKQSKMKISKAKQSFFSLKCCKQIEETRLKVVEDCEDKLTMETSWDIFDFL